MIHRTTWACRGGTWQLHDESGAVLASLRWDREAAQYVSGTRMLGPNWEAAKLKAQEQGKAAR